MKPNFWQIACGALACGLMAPAVSDARPETAWVIERITVRDGFAKPLLRSMHRPAGAGFRLHAAATPMTVCDPHARIHSRDPIFS